MIWLLPWEERNDTRHFHWAVYFLLLVNIVVFAAAYFGDKADVSRWYHEYALTPASAHWYQYFTANFLHGDVWHLLGNMLFLWLFGDNVEDILGPLGFLLLYFAGGIAGNLIFVGSNPELAVMSLGASGCIATVAGAYALLFAKHPASVRVMFLVFPVAKIHLHAFWLLLLWFAVDVVRTFWGRGTLDATERINFVAHGVGFAIGFSVAVWAVFYGVVRRYEALKDGDALFGYFPMRLDDEVEKQKQRELARARAQMPAPKEPADRSWRLDR